MSSIRQIADEIYSKENTKSYRDFVDNFEKHCHSIETIKYNETMETYDTFSQLIADYGIALAETQSYKKAIPVLDKALNLLQNNKNFSPESLRNLEFYQVLLFNRGKSYFNLDNFELAKPDFELLTELYPDNSIYPKWTSAIKNKYLNRTRNILWYCVAGFVIVESFLSKESYMKDIAFAFGAISLLSAISIEVILYYRRKKSDT